MQTQTSRPSKIYFKENKFNDDWILKLSSGQSISTSQKVQNIVNNDIGIMPKMAQIKYEYLKGSFL